MGKVSGAWSRAFGAMAIALQRLGLWNKREEESPENRTYRRSTGTVKVPLIESEFFESVPKGQL